MRKLFFLLFTITFILVSKTKTQAQSYDNAIGVRLGACNGITFKTWVAETKAVDLSLNYIYGNDYTTYCLTGLYEAHANTDIVPRLLWYYGGGASIGSRIDKHTNIGKLLVSVDGVVGLDYKFEKEPINLALDWKPAVRITSSGLFDAGGLNLSIRYTF